MTSLLKPWMPLLVSLLIYCATLYIYVVEVKGLLTLFTLLLGLALICLFTYTLNIDNQKSNRLKVRMPFPRGIAYLVIASSLIEYMVFGIPLMGDGLYTEFGFPLIHHLAVTSWLLIFIFKAESNKLLRRIFLAFALLNPLLMLNRDILLLTLFCIMTIYLKERKVRLRSLVLIMLLVLILFGLVGQVRSPLALGIISLPFSFDTSLVPEIVMWPLIYITSSAFNMFYNLDLKSLDLYCELINVFPEAYRWVADFGYFAFPTFYFFVMCGLTFFNKISSIYGEFYPVYIYFVYQAYMSIFSVKVFTTNSFFVVILIGILFIIKNAAVRKKSDYATS